MKTKKILLFMTAILMTVSFSACGQNSSSSSSAAVNNSIAATGNQINLVQSKSIMEEYINRDQYAVKIDYEGMNLNYYYAKDNDREFLGSTVGNVQSGIFREGNITYSVDIVGSGKLRRIENDTTDINVALQTLDLIYNQTVINGQCKDQSADGDGNTVNTYEYNDEESGNIIIWKTYVQPDGMLLKAVRTNDNRIFSFSYPEFTDEVFTIPDDYIIVDDDGNPVNGTASWKDYQG